VHLTIERSAYSYNPVQRKKKITRQSGSLISPSSKFVARFQATPPPLLYHYTGQSAFLDIVRTKSIWATDLRFLNDFEEYTFAVDCAKEAVAALARKTNVPGARDLGSFVAGLLGANRAHEYYVFSLCENGDSLNQWRSYTRPGPGYGLGFSTRSLESQCKSVGGRLGKCIYGKKVAREVITDLAQGYFRDLSSYFPCFGKGEVNEDLIYTKGLEFFDLFLGYAAFMKNAAFEQENEWRIVLPFNKVEGGISFRNGPHSIVPYAVLRLEAIGFLQALRRVVLKPTPHMELAEKAVSAFVKLEHRNASVPDYDTKDFEVVYSEVPYREEI